MIASLDVAETPKSKEGMSGGGDDKGFDTPIVRLAFLGRSKSSGSIASYDIFALVGEVNIVGA